MPFIERDVVDPLDVVQTRIGVLGLQPWEDVRVTLSDRCAYRVENLVSTIPYAYYFLLFGLTGATLLFLGAGWWLFSDEVDHATLLNSVFFAFQIFAIGGYDPDISAPGPIIFYVLMIFCGLTIFAILIGMITESFQAFVAGMNEGKTKATINGHTLILGWNEATVRVVVQIARLRNTWCQQNRTLSRRLFWWTRVQPSTPVAAAPVVIMANTVTKAEMQEAIELALAENGISTRDARVGKHIICRIGNPTAPHDLQRVGAHRAMSILIQMTAVDWDESQQDGLSVRSGATMRTLLSLRAVLSTCPSLPFGPYDRRVVAQLSAPSAAIDCIDLGRTRDGRPTLRSEDLNEFVNGLMFGSLSQRGLAYALIDLLGFEGAAFRSRRVKNFPAGGQHLVGKTWKDMASMWENAIFVGIAGKNDGLVPSGDRVLQLEDRIVFVSDSSMPEMTKSPPAAPPTFQKWALDLKEGSSPRGPAQVQHVLVCGWKGEWDTPENFAALLRASSADLCAGSQIVFLCEGEFPEESFGSFMRRVCACNVGATSTTEEAQWSLGQGVSMRHIAGNAEDYRTLARVVQETEFNHALILSSTEVWKLPPELRDTRAMAIMVSLRQLQIAQGRPPMHVIVECALDSTALLAIGPTLGNIDGEVQVPDFVNAYVICASALVHGLAYPMMFASVSELFSPRAGTPNLRIEPAAAFVPSGEHTFGTLSLALKNRFPDDVLLGTRRADGRMTMAPRLSESIAVEAGDSFILLTRRTHHAHACACDLQDTQAALGTRTTQQPQKQQILLPGQAAP